MGALTVVGQLITGLTVDGASHKDFELRLPTLGDNVAAVDEVGAHNALALNAAIIARSLTKLGSLKPSQISYELLCQLHPSDYNLLDAAASELEKKRLAAAAPRTAGVETLYREMEEAAALMRERGQMSNLPSTGQPSA